MLRSLMHLGFCGLLATAAVAQSRPSSAPAANPAAAQRGAQTAARYELTAQRIIQAAMRENAAYDKLERLCDDVGCRISGSPALERAVDWAVATLRADGQDCVRAEPVMVPKWVRGEESLQMIEPRRRPVEMLGLGGSVGTPEEGITAPVVSVRDENALRELGDAVAGRIVLFDFPMPTGREERGAGYGSAVRFRGNGASWAAKQGAVACLIRSVTTRSLRSPHTGAMHYVDTPRRIPAAAVSVEDAAMISRLCARGVPVVVTLKMQARDERMSPSANVVAELCGSERPDEIVVISGHLDSWDVGQGANDDGGGCATAMEAINVLRKLNLRPRRTIRVVLWTNEENGLAGGRQYARDHEWELPRHVAAIESDSGVFAPTGFSVDHRDAQRQSDAAAELEALMSLVAALEIREAGQGHSGADVSPMREFGVLLMGQNADMTHYFDVHHTHADTLDKVDPYQLSRHVAAMATMAYVLADMPGRLGEN
ncbi:MAG: M20/M25/M40 family metallo-hydrolase [Phycisphaerae bacterium]